MSTDFWNGFLIGTIATLLFTSLVIWVASAVLGV